PPAGGLHFSGTTPRTALPRPAAGSRPRAAPAPPSAGRRRRLPGTPLPWGPGATGPARTAYGPATVGTRAVEPRRPRSVRVVVSRSCPSSFSSGSIYTLPHFARPGRRVDVR